MTYSIDFSQMANVEPYKNSLFNEVPVDTARIINGTFRALNTPTSCKFIWNGEADRAQSVKSKLYRNNSTSFFLNTSTEILYLLYNDENNYVALRGNKQSDADHRLQVYTMRAGVGTMLSTVVRDQLVDYLVTGDEIEFSCTWGGANDADVTFHVHKNGAHVWTTPTYSNFAIQNGKPGFGSSAHTDLSRVFGHSQITIEGVAGGTVFSVDLVDGNNNPINGVSVDWHLSETWDGPAVLSGTGAVTGGKLALTGAGNGTYWLRYRSAGGDEALSAVVVVA